MKLTLFPFLLFVGLFANANLSHAEVEDLVSFGTFADTNETHNRIGGMEVYEINCDQGNNLCMDNFGNAWAFGTNLPDTYVMLCDETLDVVADDCVHLVEVVLVTTQRYGDLIVEEQRNGCPRNNVFLDGEFIGSTEKGHRGVSMNVKYAAGFISKNKPHTMMISFSTISNQFCGEYDNPISGIGISGVPLKRGNK